MNDERKTKAQLIAELTEMRQRTIELEAAKTDRQRLDAALRDSETRYRRLFETAQDGILLLDAATGQITDVNPFLEKLLGYSHAELIGHYLWEIGPFKNVAESKLAFERLQRDEYIRYEDLPLETRDGQRMAVEFVSNVYRVNGAKIIQCNVRDITARRRAEEALARLNQRHVTDMSALYAITRTTSRSLALEDVLEQALSSTITLLGFSAGLIVLTKSDEALPQTSQPGELRLAAARGLPADLVTRFRCEGLQNTLTAYVHQHRESLIIAEGEHGLPPEVDQAMSRLIDQGYRAYAGIALLHQGLSLGTMSLFDRGARSSSDYDLALLGTIGQQIAVAVMNARLFQVTLAGHSHSQALINSSRDGIILIGMNGHILILNKPAFKLLRLPGQTPEWLGRSLKDTLPVLRVVAPAALRAAIVEVRRLRPGNELPGEGEIEMPPQAVRWVSLPVMAGTLPQGRLIVLSDVTDERAVEHLREDMTHALVHDLRNPLSIICGTLDMVTDGMLGEFPPDQLEALQLAHHGAKRMIELVNAILDVSRLESGQMPLEKRALNLARLVAEALTAQTSLARDKQIRLDNRMPLDLPQAWADTNLLARVLQNLIGNAIKFTPPGGVVQVTATWEAQAPRPRLLVQVSDTGSGIPPAIQSRLFQKFVSGAQREHGSGLGLAFCKLAIEAHGERIWVESTPGQGTTFRFSLAIAPSST